jgi:antitoxin component YwqK of YwqJK toxin-antitoxin module
MNLKSLFIILCFWPNLTSAQVVCLELFHDNGNPKSIEYFDQNGQQVKAATYFFANKQLHYKEQFKNNYKVGTVTVYFENGNVNKTIKYSKKGTRRTETTFYKSGSKRSVEKFLGYKKDGKCIYYLRDTEKIYKEENYKNNKKHGKVVAYKKDGKPYKNENYKEGKKHGLCIQYYPDGTLREEANYKNGITEGVCKYYYKNGIVKYILEYGEADSRYGISKLLNVMELNDSNGNALDKGTLKDGNGTYYEYNDKGKLLRTFDVIDGVKKYRRN